MSVLLHHIYIEVSWITLAPEKILVYQERMVDYLYFLAPLMDMTLELENFL